MLTSSVGTIAKLYPSAISPKPQMIAVYIVMIYLGQIGYCILLVLARKPETKVKPTSPHRKFIMLSHP